MKSFRQQSSARLLTVVLLMVSWLVATNHCAIGLMKPARSGAASTHAHCHGGCPAPGKSAPVDGTQECCKSIVGALAPEGVGAKFDGAQFELQLCAFLRVTTPPTAERARCLVFDHGPPRVVSFAEAVLQRSLLSHAPPFTV